MTGEKKAGEAGEAGEAGGEKYNAHSPLTTHYSLLTTHYSLLITHYSALSTQHSALTNFDVQRVVGLVELFRDSVLGDSDRRC